MSNIHAQRLAALRQAMKEQKIDVWIAPSADPHISEYLPEHWHSRTWLSSAVNPHPALLGLLGTTLVSLRRLEDGLLLTVDDHRGRLEGEAEGVPGHGLIGPATNAEDHVGASKALRHLAGGA